MTRPLQPSTFLVPGTSPYQPGHLFGHWDGLLDWLHGAGIDPYLAFTGEAAGNVSGGERQSGAYAQQVTLSADLDWFRIAGVRGLTTHVTIVNRTGNNLSGAIGNLFNVQEIYGGGGYGARLAYLTLEQALAGGRVNVMAGRMEAGTDFAASALYCSFQNLGLCPNPEALYLNGRASNGGFQIFPYSSWGGRLRVRPWRIAYLQIGIFELNPSLSPESGWNWSISGATGVQVPVEVGVSPGHGPHQLPGHYKLGASFDTATHPALPNRGALRTHRDYASVYLLADQMLVRTGDGDSAGLVLLGGLVWSKRSTAKIDRFGFLGTSWVGLLGARPKDSVNLLAVYGHINSRWAPSPMLGRLSDETDLELNYTLVSGAVSVKPNLQYIVRPGASSRYGNAVVLGMQLASLL